MHFQLICIAFVTVSVISAKDPESKDQPNTTEPKWKRCSYPSSYQTIINGCIKTNFPLKKQGLMKNSKFQAELEKHDNDLRNLLELCGSERDAEVYITRENIYNNIIGLLKKKLSTGNYVRLLPCLNPAFVEAATKFPHACGRARATEC